MQTKGIQTPHHLLLGKSCPQAPVSANGSLLKSPLYISPRIDSSLKTLLGASYNKFCACYKLYTVTIGAFLPVLIE